MADTYTATIPYESLDPLTIGASGDDDKVSSTKILLDLSRKLSSTGGEFVG